MTWITVTAIATEVTSAAGASRRGTHDVDNGDSHCHRGDERSWGIRGAWMHKSGEDPFVPNQHKEGLQLRVATTEFGDIGVPDYFMVCVTGVDALHKRTGRYMTQHVQGGNVFEQTGQAKREAQDEGTSTGDATATGMPPTVHGNRVKPQ